MLLKSRTFIDQPLDVDIRDLIVDRITSFSFDRDMVALDKNLVDGHIHILIADESRQSYLYKCYRDTVDLYMTAHNTYYVKFYL
jgi:hypothetical protein